MESRNFLIHIYTYGFFNVTNRTMDLTNDILDAQYYLAMAFVRQSVKYSRMRFGIRYRNFFVINQLHINIYILWIHVYYNYIIGILKINYSRLSSKEA